MGAFVLKNIVSSSSSLSAAVAAAVAVAAAAAAASLGTHKEGSFNCSFTFLRLIDTTYSFKTYQGI